MQHLLCFSVLSRNIKIKICRTIISPVVLCGCETWSLTLREECRLNVFENRGLRRIFVSKRDINCDWSWNMRHFSWKALHLEDVVS
jgi:hypothetical protein